jgi:hypothetical protein
MTALAIALVLATIVLGAVVGAFFLQGARRPTVVTAHLALALAGAALILFLAATREAPFSGLVPLALIAAAIAAGWSAGRVARRSRTLANVMLPAHVAAGIAAFFVLLAWVKAP